MRQRRFLGPPSRMLRGVLVLGMLALVIDALSSSRAVPARAAGAGEFSAERALAFLDRIFQGNTPHPAGSEESARIRQRIVDEFRTLGYEPSIQEGLACNVWGTCGSFKNVVVRSPGAGAEEALLLSAHYDSRASGPGIADDAAGVASLLEVARALKAGPAHRNAIVFLIDDGEEAGLLGAEGFVREHPLARSVQVAINVEARGTWGPSLMFETSANNAWLIRHLARSAPHPVSTSLFPEVYSRLSSDTNLRVFKGAGMEAMNFAFIGGASAYHTPLDDRAHLSPASVQHQGDNILALVRALADADLHERSQEDAVFFDLRGSTLVWWPAAWTPYLGAAGLLLLSAALFLRLRAGVLTMKALGWGLLGWLMSLSVAVAAAWAVGSGLSAAGAIPSPWPATPAPALGVLCLLGAASVMGAGAAFGERMGWWGAWGASWWAWSLVGLILAILVPEVSFLFLSPVLVAGGAALIGSSRPALEPGVRRDLVACAPLALALMLWLPLGVLLYQAVGLSWHAIFAGLAALLANLCLPWLIQGLRSRILAAGMGSALLAGGIIALVVPPYSSTHPQLLRFVYLVDAGTHEARLLADVVGRGLPDSVRQAGGFGATPMEAQPWMPVRFTTFERRATGEAAAPRLDVLERASTPEGTQIRARLFSPRGAGSMRLALPPEGGGQVTRIDDRPTLPMSERRLRFTKGWHVLDLVAVPKEGVVVVLKFAAGATPVAYVLDRSPGLPEDSASVAAGRDASVVPFGDGDETVVVQQVRF